MTYIVTGRNGKNYVFKSWGGIVTETAPDWDEWKGKKVKLFIAKLATLKMKWRVEE